MSLYINGHSFVRRRFTPRVVAEFSKVIDDAYSRVKVAGQGGLTVPRLRRQVRDIERFGASVVIADIGTNDLSPSNSPSPSNTRCDQVIFYPVGGTTVGRMVTVYLNYFTFIYF